MHAKLTSQRGQRDAVVTLMLKAVQLLDHAPGCEFYMVSISPTEPDVIWVTEVWRSEDDHDASLSITGVRDVIEQARPLLSGMEAIPIKPVGGVGFSRN